MRAVAGDGTALDGVSGVLDEEGGGEVERKTYNGSTQVGHLYLASVVLQTPHFFFILTTSCV